MAKSRTVMSPAGERVEIVPDEDWSLATGTSPNALRSFSVGMKPLVFRALWEHGEFTNRSGRASKDLLDYVSAQWPDEPISPSISHIWNEPVNHPVFGRKSQGKRTYAIKLMALPENWYGKLLADIQTYPSPSVDGDQAQEAPETAPQAPVAALDVQEAVVVAQDSPGPVWTDADWEAMQLDAPTVYEEPPPLELHIANQVAMSLLTTVVEIISAGNADTSQLSGARRMTEELQSAQHLLSQRLMENDKLRRQLREAGDHISALKLERDGLRSRLRMTEHNLTEVLKGETAQAVNSEIQKRVDQFMRTPPTPKGD